MHKKRATKDNDIVYLQLGQQAHIYSNEEIAAHELYIKNQNTLIKNPKCVFSQCFQNSFMKILQQVQGGLLPLQSLVVLPCLLSHLHFGDCKLLQTERTFISSSSIAKELNISQRTARRYLTIFEEQQIIFRIGRKFFLNPYIAFSGTVPPQEIMSLAINSSFFDKSIFIPQKSIKND